MGTTNRILIIFIVFFSLNSHAYFSKKDFSAKLKSSHELMKTSVSLNSAYKHFESLKAYVTPQRTKKPGKTYRYLIGLKLALEDINMTDIKSGKCKDIKHGLYLDFAPSAKNIKETPPYLQDVLRTLKILCKKA